MTDQDQEVNKRLEKAIALMSELAAEMNNLCLDLTVMAEHAQALLECLSVLGELSDEE